MAQKSWEWISNRLTSCARFTKLLFALKQDRRSSSSSPYRRLTGSIAWLCIRPRFERNDKSLTDEAQHFALQGIPEGKMMESKTETHSQGKRWWKSSALLKERTDLNRMGMTLYWQEQHTVRHEQRAVVHNKTTPPADRTHFLSPSLSPFSHTSFPTVFPQQNSQWDSFKEVWGLFRFWLNAKTGHSRDGSLKSSQNGARLYWDALMLLGHDVGPYKGRWL